MSAMALPREYTAESCPIARSLEIVGERWTLLIVRDAFYGVRRFSDFRAHLSIPKAVLSERLSLLVSEGVLTRTAGGREYELTPKGVRLWPTIWSLLSWGNDNYVEQPHRRTYRHADCGGTIGPDRVCSACGLVPDVADLVTHPPRRPRDMRDDPVSETLRRPHRMLEPMEPNESPRVP
jgi:DNA-binding HxlR family transcriptional regulator